MKGVFCIEGFWYGDQRDKTSVYPVLDVVHRYEGMPFIHHRCATVKEFEYCMSRWKTKSFHEKYPLLYLSFHGEKGIIKIGKETVSIDELADLLEDKCNGVIIYFGACSTVDIDKRKLQSFMNKTGTLAVFGYRKDVDWLRSASFEILLLSYFLRYPFDSSGIKQMSEELYAEHKYLINQLDFRMELNEKFNFPRKSEKKNLLIKLRKK
ncbi:MAG: DUF6642 family protein [Bacteroidota bacterium]